MAPMDLQSIRTIPPDFILQRGAATLRRRHKAEEYTFRQTLEKSGGTFFHAISTCMTSLSIREIPRSCMQRVLNRRFGVQVITAKPGNGSRASTLNGRTGSFPIPLIATASTSPPLAVVSGMDLPEAMPAP